LKKFILRSLLFIIIFYALNLIAGAVLSIPKEVLINAGLFDPKLRWDEFHSKKPDSIDLLFLGSSHCYRSFDPAVFDGALNISSFNLGSGSQSAITAYYALREALCTQKPKTLVFEVYWMVFRDEPQFVNASYNYEYMKDPAVKREFLMNGYAPSDYINFILPAVRYRNNLGDLINIALDKPKWLSKFSDRYRPGGFVENASAADIKKNNQFGGYVFKNDMIGPKNLEYFHKIIALCREKSIRLILVKSPLPPTSFGYIKNYSAIYDHFAKLARENSLTYIDYNVMKDTGLTDADFKDDNHLNSAGVKKISADLAAKLKDIIAK